MSSDLIEIKQIGNRDLSLFVKYPFELYKDCQYWIPPIVKDEINFFDSDKNKALINADVGYFLAYKGSKIVGRVAAMINRKEVTLQNKKKVRFGWLDFIEDYDVCKALLDKVSDFGRQEGMTYVEGPVGLSNLDKAGMLTEGFNFRGKITTYYNHSYYPKIIRQLGYKVENIWTESEIEVPKEELLELKKISAQLMKRYKLKRSKPKSKKETLTYLSQMIDLINISFKELPTYTPIEELEIQYYKNRYANFIHPDFVSFIFDNHGKMIAFGITIPDLSLAFKKMNGRLWPFGLIYLARAYKRCERVNLNFIAIHPDYQKKGLTAIIFSEIAEIFQRRGIKNVDVGPGLNQNKGFVSMWKRYDARVIRKRATFIKNI